MNPCEEPPSTIHISCRDFGDSDSDGDSSDSEDEDNTPKLAHRYNPLNTPKRTEHKPLRLRGGCDPVEIHTRPPQVGTIRVETVENLLTDDDTSQTSDYTTEPLTDDTPSYNPMADAPDPDIITP